jgi:hypothetical protein
MGTHSNQSDGPASAVNQNQVVLSAKRNVPVNCEGENTQIFPLYSMALQPKDATDQDNIHVSFCIYPIKGRGGGRCSREIFCQTQFGAVHLKMNPNF